MEIKVLEKSEYPAALYLIRETFDKFVAGYYSEEGVNNFKARFSSPEVFYDAVVYGAFSDDGELAGVMAAVNDLAHIIAFYVKEKYQKQGVGKGLFERLAEDSGNSYVTVNASPYAVGIYRKLGFIDAGETEDRDGIIFTPMMKALYGITGGEEKRSGE